jgi:RimJ/RimL family protein N-acetyltransferase
MSSTITIEPVVFSNEQHMSQWYAIRAEKTVREGSRSAKKITPEQHRIWWEESGQAQDRMLYFIREECERVLQTVGILRLDHRGTWMEVWLAIKQDRRRQGIATKVLTMLISRAVAKQYPPLGAVVSAKRSAASWKLFVRAGFIPKRDGFMQLVRRVS